MKIITLTLNPAFDVHCQCDDFDSCKESLARITSRQAGGKGVNISRALNSLKTPSLAFCLLGEENGDEFERILRADGVAPLSLRTKGRIRENYTIHTKSRPETRISFSGFELDSSRLEDIEKLILPYVSSDSVVTLTGRLPAGICAKDVRKLLQALRNKGARTVIDSRSFDLDELISARPWLIKPNAEEISEYLKSSITDLYSAIDGAKELYKKGISNVMISLGGIGALLCSDSGIYLADAPRVEVVSTVGAGDSSIAGFISAKQKGCSDAEALCLAVACGSAACTTQGTNAPKLEMIEALRKKTEIKKI
ncbi:MAG: 1-phosphofructokinase family hexose kinase [Ruminococcaceae bacterium]|nr:1-phosphofructokinase family hexose kinase [Oscillospiraceae bacterium]